MKHLFLLVSLLFTITCSNSHGDYSYLTSTCDTTVNHVVTGKVGTEGSEYHVAITVDGTPMMAIADTGSSNLLIAPTNGFEPANPTGNSFNISYGDPASSTATLTQYKGEVDLNCGPRVKEYKYGYIKDYKSNNGTSAATLLGLGYRDLQEPPEDETTPTFFRDLVDKDGISNEFAMLLCGVNNKSSEINFGGVSSKFTGKFSYTPILKGSLGYNDYYNVGAGAVTMGTTSVGSLKNIQTIVDSGTTLNLVPESIYNSIVSKLHGVNVGSPGSVISCPSSTILTGLPNVAIALGDSVTLTITPQTYFKNLGGGKCFFGFAPGGGNMAILGQVTMENYYVHFDRKFNDNEGRIGFGPNTMCNP